MTTTASTSPACPRCGAILAVDAPEGLCPRCLAAFNLQSGTMTGDPAPSLPPPPVEEIAPHFPQLEILSCLGRGGMGVVYKARQKSLDRIVALKLLAPEREKDPEFAARFEREARALAKLSHPHIVTVYDFGQAGKFFYLLMEYIDGANLRTLLQAHKFTPSQALAIVPPLCDALQYAHDRGIVHRDIKPENLLMDKDGKVKVADFGLAKMLGGDALPADESPAGTPSYMAPEQADDPAHVDNRADIYSLGVVFYEMLTGELPGSRLETSSRVVRIDVRLDEIVLRALEKDPQLRYQQASVFKTQVENVASAAAGKAVPPSAPPQNNAAADARKLESLRRLVSVPATGLRIAGWVAMIACLWMIVVSVLYLAHVAHNPRTTPGGPGLDAFAIVPMWLPLAVEFIAGFIIMYGASRMQRLQNYGLAATVAVLAIIMPPGLIIGLPFGIWSLIILTKAEVRDAFETVVLPPPRPRWSRRKLVGTGSRLLAVAGIIILGGVILIYAIPRTYTAWNTIEVVNDQVKFGQSMASVDSAAGRDSVLRITARSDWPRTVAILAIPNSDLLRIMAKTRTPQSAADQANAAIATINARLKADFPDRPGMRLRVWEKVEVPGTPSGPNRAAILIISLFIALPFFALPGFIMFLMGIFRLRD